MMNRDNAAMGMSGCDPAFDLKTALDQLDGSQDFLLEVIRLFQEDGPRLLDAVRAAVSQADADALRTAAHALKGATSYVAARPTVEAAECLEKMGTERNLIDANNAVVDLEREFERLMAALSAALSVPVP